MGSSTAGEPAEVNNGAALASPPPRVDNGAAGRRRLRLGSRLEPDSQGGPADSANMDDARRPSPGSPDLMLSDPEPGFSSDDDADVLVATPIEPYPLSTDTVAAPASSDSNLEASHPVSLASLPSRSVDLCSTGAALTLEWPAHPAVRGTSVRPSVLLAPKPHLRRSVPVPLRRRGGCLQRPSSSERTSAFGRRGAEGRMTTSPHEMAMLIVSRTLVVVPLRE